MTAASKHLAILGWLMLGLTLSVVNLLAPPTWGADATIRSAARLRSTTVEIDPSQRVALFQAWDRWAAGEHAVSGLLIRRIRDEETVARYREARGHGHWLRQIGPSVVMADEQGRRVCHQDGAGQFLCTTMAEATSPVRSPSPAADPTGSNGEEPGDGTGSSGEASPPDHLAAADHAGSTDSGGHAVSSELSGYTVWALDHGEAFKRVVGTEPSRPGACWEARADPSRANGASYASADADSRWGLRSWFCFDAETGALMLRHTIRDGWTETAVARVVAGAITGVDLAPSPTLASGQPQLHRDPESSSP